MKRRVLLVDDDVDVLDALEGLLEANYDVVAAEDGVKALQLLGADHFDCVLLDLMMPRMSGAKVAEHMKQAGVVVPILLASAAMDLGEQATRLGAADFIAKPYDVDLLEAKLAKLMPGGNDPPAQDSSFPGHEKAESGKSGSGSSTARPHSGREAGVRVRGDGRCNQRASRTSWPSSST